MISTVAKFWLLWIICEIIGRTRSFSLKYNTYDENIKTQRSPHNNISLLGLYPISVPNPISTARESINNLRNVFAPAFHKNKNHQSSIQLNMKSTQSNNEIINADTIHYIPNSMIKQANLSKVDENIIQQEDKNKMDKKSEPESDIPSHNTSSKTAAKVEVLETNDSTPENETNLDNNIDKKLLDYIFQMAPDNNIDTTTVDPYTDFTTETDDYDNTTTDELLRIPAPVVASLLG